MDDLLPSSPAYHDPPLHPSYGYGCPICGRMFHGRENPPPIQNPKGGWVCFRHVKALELHPEAGFLKD